MKLTTRKYDGDDEYSWAVFRSEDVKGKRGIIFYGEANPLVAGCSKREATYHKKRIEKRDGE